MKDKLICEISDLKNKHYISSDLKLKIWGYGEWVEEPDEITFVYKAYRCKILRILNEIVIKHLDKFTPDEIAVSGIGLGHLCGYVCIPATHPLHNVQHDDIDVSVHGGLTFSNYDDDTNEYWIGFDCAHSDDLIPSKRALISSLMPYLMDSFRGSFPHVTNYIRDRTYKNIDFVQQEVIRLTDQLHSTSHRVEWKHTDD